MISGCSPLTSTDNKVKKKKPLDLCPDWPCEVVYRVNTAEVTTVGIISLSTARMRRANERHFLVLPLDSTETRLRAGDCSVWSVDSAPSPDSQSSSLYVCIVTITKDTRAHCRVNVIKHGSPHNITA